MLFHKTFEQDRSAHLLFWISIITLQVLLVAVCCYLPWIQSSLLLTFFFLGLLFLIKPEAACYPLIFLVTIVGAYAGFYFKTTGIGIKTGTITFPLFTPILFLAVAALIIKKTARVEEAPVGIKHPLVALFLLLILYAVLSLRWSPDIPYSFFAFCMLAVNFLLYYYTISVVDSERLHQRLMICWVWVGVVQSVFTMSSFFNIPAKILYWRYITNTICYVYNSTTEVHYRGHAIGHPNATATILNMTACVTIGLLLCGQSKRKTVFLWTALPLIVFANFLTQSKGGIGSFLAMVIFFHIFSGKLRRKIFSGLSLSMAGIVIIFLLSTIYLNLAVGQAKSSRLLTYSRESGGEVVAWQDRLDMWKSGREQMKRRGEVFSGLSAGGFQITTVYPHSHNFYFSFFFDFGLAGIIFLVGFLGYFLKVMWDFLRKHFVQQTYFQVMSLAFIGGILAFAIHSIVDQYYLKNVVWIFLGLAVATFTLMNSEQTKVPQEGIGHYGQTPR